MPSMPAMHGSRRYTPRIVDRGIDVLFAELGAIALEGAKAVGKTATAMRRAERVMRLDDDAVAAVVRASPDDAIRAPFPVFFDEWQRVPAIWDAVRRRVDEDSSPGLVLLAGSARPQKTAQPTHSGAGRIVTRRMRPLAISERLTASADTAAYDTAAYDAVSVRALLATAPRPALRGSSPWSLRDYAREIVASGFPAIRPLSANARRAQLDGYIDHLTTRDIEEATGASANPAAVRRWLTAFAAATSTTTSLEKLRDVAAADEGTRPAKTTVLRYRDALERLFVYDPVAAWRPGGTALSRMGEAPKLHLVDPARSAHLLGIDEDALLDGASTPLTDAIVRDGGLFGALFESLVAQSMRTYAQAADVGHWYLRTHGGEHEIDGLLVRRDQRCVAYEVKLARDVTDHDVRDLRWLREKLGPQLLDALVITTGPEAYRRADGIGVIPAAMLVP